jgi:hypothetical protein
VIRKAVLDHVAVTDRPANAAAIITSRRDINAVDRSGDAALAAAVRARKVLEALRENWSIPAKPAPRVVRNIGPACGLIYGDIPAAMLKRPTQFGQLVARLSSGGD